MQVFEGVEEGGSGNPGSHFHNLRPGIMEEGGDPEILKSTSITESQELWKRGGSENPKVMEVGLP